MNDYISSHLLECIEDYYLDESMAKAIVTETVETTVDSPKFEREMISKYPPLNRATRRRIKAKNRKKKY